MNTRLQRVFVSSLLTLMCGLFSAAFLLNRSQYATAGVNAEAALMKQLKEQAVEIRKAVAQQEADVFKLHGTTRELEANLFIVRDDRVMPACAAGLLNEVSAQEAEAAFRQGIDSRSATNALPFFELAAKRTVQTPDDLYRKIAAHFNMLETKYRVQTVCRILALLYDPDGLLTKPQKQFFNALLKEQVPDLVKIREKSSSRWKTARLIDQKLTRQKGAYQTALDGQTLSVGEGGLAVLYVPDIKTVPPVEVGSAQSTGLHQQIIEGIMIRIPEGTVAAAKREIRKQYHAGNAILVLLAILGAGLTSSIMVAARRQRELDLMKTEFITTVSHELRTPLSLIRLHAETLHHKRIPPEKVAQYHQNILTEAERLTGIVNNILDFSRMERNTLKLRMEPTNLSALCEQVTDSFSHRLQQEGFSLIKQIEPNLVTQADSLAISQIIFNLIDNAIKYSNDEKYIRIALHHTAENIELCIADHGIGIPAHLKKKIFDDFIRSDDSQVSAQRGSGIGLGVARRLAEKMNGTIDVTDNQPKGSVFTVTLRMRDETIGS